MRRLLVAITLAWWVCLRGTAVYGPYPDAPTCYRAMHEIELAIHTFSHVPMACVLGRAVSEH